jgi:hypothetical protein
MADDNRVQIIIEAVDKYSKIISDAQKELKKVAGGAKESADSFKILGMEINLTAVAITAAIAASVKFGVESYKAFADAEMAAVGMKMAFEDAGYSGAEAFMQLSKELQKTTIYSDDELQRAAALAASFGYTEDQMYKLLPTLTDMASKGTLLTGTTMSLESALRAMTTGADGSERALRQFGITLSDAQKEELKTADEGRKLALIMDIVSKKTSGAADVMNETATGGMANLKDAWHEFIKEFGTDLAPAGNAIVATLTWVIENFTLAMESIQISVQAFIAKMVAAKDVMTGQTSWEGFKRQWSDIDNQVIDATNALYANTDKRKENTAITKENTLTLDENAVSTTTLKNKKSEEQSVMDELSSSTKEQTDMLDKLLYKEIIGIALTEQEIKWKTALVASLKQEGDETEALTRKREKLLGTYGGGSRLSGWTGAAPGFEGAEYYSGINADAMAAISGYTGPSNVHPESDGNGGTIWRHNDFMIAPGGEVMDINPRDTIVGFKGAPPFGGGGVTVYIDNVYGVNADDIAEALQKKLVNMIAV